MKPLVLSDSLLKIGEVAAASGLPVKTIRYYEEIGLLTPTVKRSHSGYRLFTEPVLHRLSFIKRAQSLGLSLNEIHQILQIRDRGLVPCDEVKSHLEAKVQAIDEQILALEALKGELKHILSDWQDYPSGDLLAQTICPNLESA